MPAIFTADKEVIETKPYLHLPFKKGLACRYWYEERIGTHKVRGGLKELLESYIAHRDEVIARRTNGTSRHERMQMLKDQLRRIADTFGDRRRTGIA